MASFFITTASRTTSTGKYFFALSDELARRGHRVFILKFNRRKQSAEASSRREQLPEMASNPTVLSWPSVRPTRWRDAYFLYHLIRRHRPDCIVGNFASVNLCMLVGWMTAVPARIAWYHTVSQAQALDMQQSSWIYTLLRLRKRLIYRFATHIIANSGASAEDVQRVYGIAPGKCSVLPFLLPDPGIGSRERLRNRIICVGRLHPSKGQATLIRAIARIRSCIPGVEVEFIGDGPCRDEYMALADALEVHDCCHFLGFLSLPEVLDRLASAALCVVTSRSEAFGLVNLEAQAVGTPVVASAVGGIKEVVLDAKTGFLVPPDDVAALSEKLILLLGNEALRREMGAAGRQHFLQAFSIRNIAVHADRLEAMSGVPNPSAKA